MKEPKSAIVIDKDGYKIDLVVVEYKEQYVDETKTTTKIVEEPMFYEMQEGENLIYKDISTAISMLKPRWINGSWQETATEEEIKEATPIEEPHPPTELELAIKELTLMIEQLNKGATVADTQNKKVESHEIFNSTSIVVNSWTNMVKNKTVEIEEVPTLFNLKDLVNRKMKEV